MRLAVTALTVLTLTACGVSSFRVRGPADPPPDQPLPGPDAVGSPDHGVMDTPLAEMRQACRTDAVPRGWIAINYLRLGDRCPKREGGNGYNGVLLQYHENRARGTTMVVCADQSTPNGWIRAGVPENEVCEGAEVDEGESTTRFIRRVR